MIVQKGKHYFSTNYLLLKCYNKKINATSFSDGTFSCFWSNAFRKHIIAWGIHIQFETYKNINFFLLAFVLQLLITKITRNHVRSPGSILRVLTRHLYWLGLRRTTSFMMIRSITAVWNLKNSMRRHTRSQMLWMSIVKAYNLQTMWKINDQYSCESASLILKLVLLYWMSQHSPRKKLKFTMLSTHYANEQKCEKFCG